MNAIESLDDSINTLYLDTPIKNIRTNAFYKKLGYIEISRDAECINYKKEVMICHTQKKRYMK